MRKEKKNSVLRAPYLIINYLARPSTFPACDWTLGRVSRYGIVTMLSLAARGILQGEFPLQATDFLSATGISHPPILPPKGRRTLLLMYGNLW